MEKKVIVSFSVATEISGKSIAEIKRKFENMDMQGEFIELLSVEDAETRDDLMEVWDNQIDDEDDTLKDVDGFIKTLENGKKEDEAKQNGLNFLLNQWETNKKWFREKSDNVTFSTEDVIKRTFEFAWASKRNFDYQQEKNN